MISRRLVVSAFASAVGLCSISRIAAPQKKSEPDLARLGEGKGRKVFHRNVSSLDDGTRKGVRLSENSGDSVAYLTGIEFS